MEATVRMASNLEFATYLVSASSAARIGMAPRQARKTSMQVYVLLVSARSNRRADLFNQHRGRHFQSVTWSLRIREGPFTMEGISATSGSMEIPSAA